MSTRKNITNYLTALKRYLGPLSKEEANEVVREIESHIFEVIDESELKGEEVDVEAILTRFGSPRSLAEKYVSHIQTGSPPPAGFKAIAKVKQGLSVTSYYGLMIFGFGFGAALLALGLANLLVPDGVMIWSEADGNSVVIGFWQDSMIARQGDVIQGIWISPVAFVGGFLVLTITHKVLRFIKQVSGGQGHA